MVGTNETDQRPARARRRPAELTVLTGAKVVSNSALRWVGPFLPTLERAFSTTTGTLTGIMGVCELGGLTTVATGPILDRGHERRVFAAGLCGVVAAMLIATGGSTATYAIGYTVLVVGVGNLTVAGHAWIGHRFAFSERGRAIGVFEMSWALAMLIGAPIVAVLIRGIGWRAPFVVLAGAAALSLAVVVRHVEPGRATPSTTTAGGRLPWRTFPPLFASAATAAAGLGLFVVSGAWLDDRHGVSTGGLGVVAAAYGAVELGASTLVVVASDRFGARRSVFAGLLVLLAGCGVVAVSGNSTILAVIGLLVFLAGFEYAFVSSLTLVTEAAPEARGRTIGLSNAFGTLTRAGSVVLTGQLYEAYGMGGSLVWIVTAAGLAVGLTCISPTRRQRTR